MTKMIKLSLAAAVAVSALTTTATAGSLEDAIKDTTISGKILVGYNYKEVKDTAGTKTNTNETEYDIDLTLNTKVNDTITAQVGFEADHSNLENASTSKNTVYLTKLNFTAKTDVATVIVGKQKQPTPFYDDERGDGVVALIPAGPVTIAAGHFTGMNSDLNDNAALPNADYDITAAAVIGTFGPVNASVWYANLGSNLADAISLNVNGVFGPVNVDLTHSSAELGATGSEDETLTKLIISGKAADVNLVFGYGMTNDTAARVHGVDLTADDDAKTNFVMDQIKLDAYSDADAILLGASMTFGQTTVGANYLMATIDNDAGADTKGKELDLTVKYAMSKNFSITGLYADTTIKTSGAADTQDTKHMELSLNYKF